jgi:hypothetical protein
MSSQYFSEERKKQFLTDTERTEETFVHDCSQIIDILQQIGGTQDYIESFGVNYDTASSCQEILKGPTYVPGSLYVIFIASSRRAGGNIMGGHFHFINASGTCGDSYKLGWQKTGSNGFCQTFALMGALGKAEAEPGIPFGPTLSKEEHSRAACNFIISNNRKWYNKYWKKLCIEKGYSNIKDLSINEIIEDLNAAMRWTTSPRGGSTIFWKLVLDEVVYV